ncbi:MAG: hypothetical protein R2824_28870 [Saprospiraceae bacterium]
MECLDGYWRPIVFRVRATAPVKNGSGPGRQLQHLSGYKMDGIEETVVFTFSGAVASCTASYGARR